MKIAALAPPAILLAASAARAGAPDDSYRVLPCRPTVSCTADLVAPGALEIEAGYLARRAPPRGFVHSEPILLKLTLAEWVQAQVGGNGHVVTSGDVARSLRYLDDISVGPKFHFVDQAGWWPSLAASASLNIPSCARLLGHGKRAPHARATGRAVTASGSVTSVAGR